MVSGEKMTVSAQVFQLCYDFKIVKDFVPAQKIKEFGLFFNFSLGLSESFLFFKVMKMIFDYAEFH